MQKLVQLANSNCPWCLNDMVERLRSRPGVRGVELDAAAGCLRVDYDKTDLVELVAEVRSDLRAWEQAANGEVVMVEVEAHPVASCRYHPSHSEEAPRSPSGAAAPEAPLEPSGGSGDGGRGRSGPKGVRVVLPPVSDASVRQRRVFGPLIWLWRRIRAWMRVE